MKQHCLLILLSVLTGFAGAPPSALAQAVYQPDLAGVPTPNVDAELAAFQVAEGFEINLFAANPDIAKPIQIHFDSEGRLWVAGSETYPHIVPGDVADDKIVVLEDRDGDGVADKSTVFADGLLIPTGIAPGDGGVYVSNSTELLHLSDSDGDGKADRRRIVLSGFGTEDTHHILHTLRWGMDGSLYMNQSIYIHSHVETPHGVRRLDGGGTWRFRPETMELEVFQKGLVNHWGHAFDEWGQSFMTDGAGGEGINYAFPGATFLTSPGARKILKGLNPGSPKHCGLEIVSGGHFSEDWSGSFITNDFRARRVCRFVLSEEGSGYSSKEMSEVVKTTHVSFRPVDVAMGPDGALYIADFYNPIIQHGEVDFRDPRRDLEHGRIWRVSRKGAAPLRKPEIVGAPVDQLLELLLDDLQWTRRHARLELRERPADSVLPELKSWLASLDPADPNFERNRLEGLWVHQNIRTPNAELLESLLESKDHRARAAAVRVVPQWRAALDRPLNLLENAVRDDHPQVRLEAVRAIARFPEPEALDLALLALDRPMDRFLDHALWLTVDERTPDWLPRAQAGETLFGGDAEKMVFALEVVDSPAVLQPVLQLLSREGLGEETRRRALELAAKFGGPAELRSMFDRILSMKEGSPESGTALLSILLQAARNRGVKPEGDLSGVGALLDSKNPALRAAALQAVGVWKIESLRDRAAAVALDDSEERSFRNAAIEALAEMGGEIGSTALVNLLKPEVDIETRMRAVMGLASIDPTAAADHAAELLANLPEGVDPTPLFNAFLQRTEGPVRLAGAIEGREIPADIAKLGIRLIGGTGRSAPELAAALTRSGGLAAERTEIPASEMEELIAAARSEGDAARGEAVYRSANLNCIGCHAVAGSGGKVGPDLSTIGASAQDDYLVESLLLPNAKIKEGYHSKTILTDEGEIFTGVPIRETDAEVVLRDQFDEEIRIPAASIESIEEGMSLMPGGLADLLTQAELADLLRFLSELGEEGPYGVSTRTWVRTWEVLLESPATQETLRVTGMEPVVHNTDFTWAKVYSKVSGAMPTEGLPAFHVYGSYSGSGKTVFLRFPLEVTTAGSVGLKFTGPEGMRAWSGTEEFEPSEETVLNLEKGTHFITLAVPMTVGASEVSCESFLVEGSSGRARPVL